ncbi:MAG: hypothetical protein HZB53_13085 [Chloroflexi bacterium]|nr:hypothetical protein [Chloroflexota bacterium]
MPKQAIQLDGGPKAGGAYSPAVRAGDFIYISGQVPRDPASGETAGDTIESQTHRVLQNIGVLLAASGASFADVVKATVHLSDIAGFARFNTVYATYFPDPKPARTTTGAQLPGGFLVEIDVTVYVGK